MLFKADYKKLNVWINDKLVKFKNHMYETKDKEEISVLSKVSGVVAVDDKTLKKD